MQTHRQPRTRYRTLGYGAAVMVLATACSPGDDEPAPPAETVVDYSAVSPPNTAVVALERDFDNPKQRFSVADAVATGANVYWFVDFDAASSGTLLPVKTVGMFHEVWPCDIELLDGDPRVFLVEAFVTRGELTWDPEREGEPRMTVDGEPYQKVTWSVALSGHPQDCVAPTE